MIISGISLFLALAGTACGLRAAVCAYQAANVESAADFGMEPVELEMKVVHLQGLSASAGIAASHAASLNRQSVHWTIPAVILGGLSSVISEIAALLGWA